jgi:hypothetical protein
LFTTGYARGIRSLGRRERGLPFLSKPFTRSQLSRKLRSLLHEPATDRRNLWESVVQSLNFLPWQFRR